MLVGDQPLPDHRALARQHREHTRREPRLTPQLGQPQGRQRGELGRLEHDRVAGRQRRCEPPPGDRHGEVPRDDDPDDAERLAERDVHAARHRDLAPEQPLRGGRVVVQHVADVAGLPAGVADRVAGTPDLQLRQLVDVGVDDRGEAAQQPGPVRGRDRTPAGPCGDGPGDGLVHLRGVERLDLGDDLLGRGVEDCVHVCENSH
jgi:hypothetical protein